MIINFLQSRSPPILPALHQRPHLKLPAQNGVESSFADDLKAIGAFGRNNKETLGELLFSFFRFYGHEFDYDKLVISVRNGKQVSKVEKGWHITNNNRFCVEEPFNVSRNLGNTLDDTSFRGLHLELRRAFDLISQGKLEECCEQYRFPEPTKRTPIAAKPKGHRPIAIQAPHTKSPRSVSSRGGRSRNGSANSRRASSCAFDSTQAYKPNGTTPNLSAQEAWLQKQAQAQLHNDLYQTYSVLQAQENSLRMQLYAQNMHNQAYAQQAQAQTNGMIKQQTSDRHRTNSFDQPPLSAPVRPDLYYFPLNYQAGPMYGYATSSTNPSSPSSSSAVPVPELRRSMQRSALTNGSGPGTHPSSTLRSHSQPAARSAPSPLSLHGQIPNPGLGVYQSMRQAQVPNFIADENPEPRLERSARTPPGESAPKEYVGYYVNEHAANFMRRPSGVHSANIMPIPTFGDIPGQGRRRLSTDQLPQRVLDNLKQRQSRSPSPLGHDRSYSTGAHSAPLSAVPSLQGVSSSNLRMLNSQTPLVVNGSNSVPVSIPNWQAAVSDGSLSEDRSSDILVGSLDSTSQVSGSESDVSDKDLSGQVTPRDPRSENRVDPPMVVNGSMAVKKDAAGLHNVTGHLTNGILPPPINIPNGLVPVEVSNGPLRLSPNSRNRLARQVPNGGMSPLDIGLSQNENPRDDLRNLSPVYETRTPSPTANRKFEPVLNNKVNGVTSHAQDEKNSAAQKLTFSNGNPSKQPLNQPKANGHTRAVKSEGAGPGTWQKIPKGKKKGTVAELKGIANCQARYEKPPANDLERKGG